MESLGVTDAHKAQLEVLEQAIAEEREVLCLGNQEGVPSIPQGTGGI